MSTGKPILHEIEEKYHLLFNSMEEGVALHHILYDETGKAIDYIIKDVNPAYEKIVGLKREDVVDKKASEIYETGIPPYLDIFLTVTETGKPDTFEIYYEPLDRYIKASVFAVDKGEFATIFEEITERKHYEKQMQETEERLKLAQKSANLGIWDWHLKSGKVNWTEELEELYGYAKGTFPGTYEAFIKNVHSEDVEKVKLIITDALNTHEPFDFDFRVIKTSGTIIWINCKGSTTLDLEGNVKVVGVNIDITERKRMEQELIRKQTEIQTLFNNSHAGMVLFTSETPYKVLVHNRAYQEFFDEPFRTNGMVGLNIYQYAPDVDRAGIVAILDEVVKTKKPKSIFDFGYKSHPDKESWFNWHISPIVVNDKVEALVSTSIDITQRHLTESALNRAHERLSIASRAAKAGIWDWNIKTGEIEWSPVMFELLGLNPEESTASFESWKSTLHPEDVEKAGAQIDEAVKNHTFLDNLYRIIKPNGDIRWINSLGETEYDEKGSPLWMTGICIDITERKMQEELLQIRSEELARSNANLQQFAYVASHDLKEPLRMITSFLQLLERRYKDQLDEEANEFIDFAVDGAKRLDKMIMDLLEFARITNLELELTDVNSEEVIEKVLLNLRVLIDENQAKITYDSLPIIKADEIKMERIFQNLIENAIKYRQEDKPRIHVSAKKQANQYLFSVSDNGLGIDSEHLERIFTIFQRLHNHGEYEGTGIGLAITQRIVHKHGGEIWAESKPGKGSTFYFSLPIR